MANIIIDIATEFTGNKAFKKADNATDKLSKNVKKLAGAFGLAFSATAVLAYGKAAVKAAAADEKAQKQLALALKNVGLGRDAAASEAYIQGLQSEFGILDDDLRPAYQTLAIAVQDTSEAQRLLNLSLDISASTGKDLKSVTSALSKAYLGSNTALSKLGVGIAKADLEAKSFKDITKQLATTFAGAATVSANTFEGSINKLKVASANAAEIIGTGLIDALTGLGDANLVNNLATAMQNTAIYIADVIRGIGKLAEALKSIPGFKDASSKDFILTIPIAGAFLNFLARSGTLTATAAASANTHLDSLTKQFPIITKITKTEQAGAKAAKDKAAAAKLKLVTDKAQLALGKGNSVFNIEAIQNNAALINQAEQLGKVTNSAQVLAIANDVARLNIKKSMLDLEAAIASGDVKAIELATAKLNADLKILNALTGQAVKMQDIKSILDSLKSRDLINLDNLDTAIAKMLELIKLQGQAATTVPTKTSTGVTASGIPVGNFIAPISTTGASIDAILEYADAAAARANAFADLLDMQNVADDLALTDYLKKLAPSSSATTIPSMGSIPIATAADIQSGNRYAAQAAATYNITIQANTVASPDELTNLIQDAVIRLNKRGDYITTAGAL